MKDNYGDKVSVFPSSAYGNGTVYLAVTSAHDDTLTDAALTPAKARKLAKALRRAADEADGTPRPPELSLVTRPGYFLDLTEDEAETLAVILYKVGGDPSTTPRRHADSLTAKLASLGLDAEALADEPRFRTPYHSAIYFDAASA